MASAALAAIGHLMTNMLPSLVFLGQGVTFILSFGMVTVLFAMIYKYLPDVIVAWNDVWIGATITALLFTIGKFAIGFYLGRAP